jgi:hypothetical protein
MQSCQTLALLLRVMAPAVSVAAARMPDRHPLPLHSGRGGHRGLVTPFTAGAPTLSRSGRDAGAD